MKAVIREFTDEDKHKMAMHATEFIESMKEAKFDTWMQLQTIEVF